MKITIGVHHAAYAAWEDGADERERIDEWTDEHTFDNARECADWLEREGIQSVSESGPYTARTWLTDLDPYQHPHSDTLTERSAHSELTDARLWAAIVHTVSRRFSGYTGPYYVERRNVFDVRV